MSRAADVPRGPGPAIRLRRLVHHRRSGPLAALLCALVAGGVVAREAAALQSERRALGRTVPVLVATEAVAAGASLDDAVVEVRAVPAAYAPRHPLGALPSAARAAAPVAAGEILVAERVVGEGRGPVGVRVPTDRVGVAVPVLPGGVPPLGEGDEVDLLAPADGAGARVATAAAVLHVADEAVTVAVTHREAPLVAAAMALGPVVIAVRGPG